MSRIVSAPLAAGTATCLACTWAAVGPDFRAEALRHRDQTRHPTAYSLEPYHVDQGPDDRRGDNEGAA